MKPKKHPYSGSRKTDNKQDRVKFAEVLNYKPIEGTRLSKHKKALFKIRLYQRIEKMGSEKLLESNRFIWSNMCLEEFYKIVT